MAQLPVSLKSLVVKEVTRERWPDFEKLFGARGAPSYCWCMVFRARGAEVEQTDHASRKKMMRTRIQKGTPVGLLGYLGDEPVAWCSIAPRATYARLVSDGTPDEGVWSIACFFVPRTLRRQGITKRMLAAAISHARKRGAKVVEAYPVDEDSPSYRFMGFVEWFEDAGFSETGRAGKRRHVMRRSLRAARKKAQ